MPDPAELTPDDLQRAVALVGRFTGVTLTEAKRSMLQGRLRSRMRELRLERYDAYLDKVCADEHERARFVDVVTTHQTQFFRTRRIWDYLSTTFLPDWAQRHHGGTLQAWSAAASTGEEACSIAICCEELRTGVADPRHGFDYRILATDVSRRVLDRADENRYEGPAVRAFSQEWPQRLARFNTASQPGTFSLAAPLRQRMRFAVANLMDEAPVVAGGFDLVLLRNVLIYFTPDNVQEVVRRVTTAMKPGAVLLIGESESLNGLDVPLDFVQPQIYRRASLR